VGVGLLATTPGSLPLLLLRFRHCSLPRCAGRLQTSAQQAVAQVVWVRRDLDLMPFRLEFCIHVMHQRRVVVPPSVIVSTFSMPDSR